MAPVTEVTLIVVGFGTGAFLLALTRILTGASSRRIDAHMVQVQAMRMRNEYARQILAAGPPVPRGQGVARGSPETVEVVEA